MKKFIDLYYTIKSDFAPQPRSLQDLGLILSKAYIILKHYRYRDFSPFEIKNSVFDIDRTTIERLIKQLSELKFESNGNYIVESEGIERTIADIMTLEVQSINPSNDEEFLKMFDFSSLKSNLLYLIQTSREGVILLKQQIILENISKLDNKAKRLNYLNTQLISLKQHKKLNDKIQFESLSKFIELEIEKWNRVVDNKSELTHFSSEQEFQDFIVSLINDKLIHNIRYSEGYRNFWRDEKCVDKQKKENEIQPFLKSILKPYCDNRNIKVARESSVSNGRIDLTFTYLNFNICLEVKKAHHQDILTAVNTQLPVYMIGEETDFGIYLILWYKSDSGFNEPKEYQTIENLISKIKIDSDRFKIQILGVDCTKPISPSKQ